MSWAGYLSEMPEGPSIVILKEAATPFLGRTIDYVMEVVELTPNTLEMRSVEAPFPMHVTYGFDQTGAETTVTLDVDGDVGGFFGKLRPLVRAGMKRNLKGDLKRLKHQLEAF